MIKEEIVFEDHGVWGDGQPSGWATAREVDPYVVEIAVRGFNLCLSPSAARRFASMLLRCAKRVEARQKQEQGS